MALPLAETEFAPPVIIKNVQPLVVPLHDTLLPSPDGKVAGVKPLYLFSQTEPRLRPDSLPLLPPKIVHGERSRIAEDTFHITKPLADAGAIYITKDGKLQERTGKELEFLPPDTFPCTDALNASPVNPRHYLSGRPLPAPASLPKMPDAAATNLKHYSQDQGLPGTIGQCLLLDSKNRLWVGTDNGLALWDGKKFAHFTTQQGLSNNYVMSLLEDSRGNIWIGTSGGGVNLFDGKKFAHFTTQQGLSNNYVRSLLEDSRGNIWIGTSGGGVNLFDGKKFAHFTTQQGLPDNAAIQLAEDSLGNVWCGTGKGLAKFKPPLAEEWHLAEVFHKPEGLQYEDFNGPGSPMLFTKHSSPLGYGKPGEMWTGVGQVLTHYIPDYTPDTLLPSVYLTAVEVGEKQTLWVRNNDIFQNFNADTLFIPGADSFLVVRNKNIFAPSGAPIPDTGRLQRAGIKWDSVSELFPYYLPINLSLPYNQNHLTFHFTASGRFNEMHEIRYRHIMQGLDEKWSSISDESKTDYRNLPPGNYTFQAAARGRNSRWSKVAEFGFEVRPPWWQTWWAYAGYAVFAFLAVWLIVWLNSRRLIAQKKILEDRVELRTHQLQEKNIELGEQKKVVEEKNKDITDSIRYARTIQDAMLPFEARIAESLSEFFILYKPKDVVSGDFYWFAEKDGRQVVIAADCTGHGVPGAFMSMIGNDLLNDIVNVRGIARADIILNELHKGIRHALKQEQTQNRDGMDIALAVIDIKNRKLQYAGAKNPLVYIQNNEFFSIKADRLAIGGLQEADEKERLFTLNEVGLSTPTTFYLFTDGYQDQFGGPNGKKFMLKNMKKLLFEHHQKPMNEQQHVLNKVMDDWKGAGVQIDDILIFGVRV